MKAAFVTRYGGPEVPEIRGTPIPETGPDQVGAHKAVVRVEA